MKHIAGYMLAIQLYYMAAGSQAYTQEVGMGGSNLLNSRSQMQGFGGSAPSCCSLSQKGNPENPLLTHTAIKCN